MKKVAISVTMLIMISLAFTSCGTLFTSGGSDYRRGVAAYESQEYVTSLRYLAQAIETNPDLTEAVELFPTVFNEGTTFYTAQVEEFSGILDRHAADRVSNAYAQLESLHENAKASGFRNLKIENFTEAKLEARREAGDRWFEYGYAHFEKGDRESLKEAVVAFEMARARNADIPDIDKLIAEVTQEATVTIAVVAQGPNTTGFAKGVVDDMTRVLSNDRFIEVVQKYDFTPGEGTIVGPMDIAITEALGKGWDYVLEINLSSNFEEISQDVPVYLPSEIQLFSGVKRTRGYQNNTTVSYRLFEIDDFVSIVVEDRLNEVDGPYEYTFSFVPAEGIRELNLGGEGKKNLRYITSTAVDTTVDKAIGTLRWDYEAIPIPAEIQDPTSQTQWYAYFSNRYNDFKTFATNESDRELFYATEVVHHKLSDTYFMIGPSLDEAIRRSKINSAIMNALSHTARSLIADEKNRSGQVSLRVGEVVANAIRDLL